MGTGLIIGIVAIILAIASGGALFYFVLAPRRQTNIRSLMGGPGGGLGKPSEVRMRLKEDPTGEEFEKLKAETRKRAKKKEKISLEEKFFQAGLYSRDDQRRFFRVRIIAPLITVPLGIVGGVYLGSAEYIVLFAVIGVLIGLQIPFSLLDRAIARRAEDIMFYLPLVIEQVVIGVSSSLDVGPCLQRVVLMADERDSHNPVTELLAHVQQLIKTGVSLDEALVEIGKLSGHTELKHSFMSLAQTSRHGGEITKQLQELADAVANQRETKIEAKIKKLELQATGPVGLVFLGFISILLIGFGSQVLKAFQ